ncbi:MAG: diacylglycerol kinase family protein [Rhizomicrobium sp.]
MKLGVISNRYSDGNGGSSAIAAFARTHSDVLVEAPESLDGLPDALARLAAAGVNHLAIDGGDGTVRDVLTAMPAAFGDAWPVLAILPSGKTNVIARDVGMCGHGVSGVRRLLASNGKGRIVEREVLEAVREGLPLVRGMFFGAGIFTYATEMAGQWTFDRGIKQSWGVALTLLRVLARHLCGLHEGTPMAFDGAAPEPQFIMLATSLQKLMLGLWPFPRVGTGDLHWLAVAAPPRGLVGALWAAWHGRLTPRPGYRGGRCDQLDLHINSPFVVDGEVYQPGSGGVRLRLGPKLRFLALKTL